MTRNDFNDLIHKTYRKLYRIAFRILGNQQEAEDAVQEVFMKMWMMNEKLVEYNDKEALAVTMTKNYSVDLLRKRRRVDNRLGSYGIPAAELSPSPFEIMAGSETMSVLKSIIEGLPYDAREIVIMRDIDQLSYEEIAAITSVNINSLRVTISRARQTIREKYNQYFYERGRT